LSRPKTVVLDESQVMIEWSDGHRSVFDNRGLREACPCAVCRGETGLLGRVYMLPTIPSVPEDVMAKEYRLVGRYAIAFAWSDGHSTGIYPYDYLLDLCGCPDCVRARAAKGST
jgi:DUF971 family protein